MTLLTADARESRWATGAWCDATRSQRKWRQSSNRRCSRRSSSGFGEMNAGVYAFKTATVEDAPGETPQQTMRRRPSST